MKKITNTLRNNTIERQNIRNTVYGSFIESVLFLHDVKMNDAAFLRVIKKCTFPFMDDPDFMEKVWNEFCHRYTQCTFPPDATVALGNYEDWVVGLPLCVCESQWNTLIMPFSNSLADESGNEFYGALPVFGYQSTVDFCNTNMTVKPIDWSQEEE